MKHYVTSLYDLAWNSFVEEEISLVSAKIQTPDGPAHTLVTIPTILHLLKSERSSVKTVPASLLCELDDTLISTFYFQLLQYITETNLVSIAFYLNGRKFIACPQTQNTYDTP